MLIANAPVVLFGDAIAKRLPLRIVRVVAALLFGFSSALAQRLPEFSESTAVLFQALPYVLTLVVVAGVIGRTRPSAEQAPHCVRAAESETRRTSALSSAETTTSMRVEMPESTRRKSALSSEKAT